MDIAQVWFFLMSAAFAGGLYVAVMIGIFWLQEKWKWRRR